MTIIKVVATFILVIALNVANATKCSTVQDQYKDECCNKLPETEVYVKENAILGGALIDRPTVPVPTYETNMATQRFIGHIYHLFRSHLRRDPTTDEMNTMFPKNTEGVRERHTTVHATTQYIVDLDEFKTMHPEMQRQMTGKTCVVAGGSVGVGFALSVLFAQRGCNVYSFARSQSKFDLSKRHAITDGAKIITMPDPWTAGSAEGQDWYDEMDATNQAAVQPDGAGATWHFTPNEADAYYDGPLNVEESVFDKITFLIKDVRSKSNMEDFVAKISADGRSGVDVVVWSTLEESSAPDSLDTPFERNIYLNHPATTQDGFDSTKPARWYKPDEGSDEGSSLLEKYPPLTTEPSRLTDAELMALTPTSREGLISGGGL